MMALFYGMFFTVYGRSVLLKKIYVEKATWDVQYRPASKKHIGASKKHIGKKARLIFSYTTRKRGASESSATLKPI